MDEEFSLEEVDEELDNEDIDINLDLSKKTVSMEMLEDQMPASIRESCVTPTQRSIRMAMKMFFQFVCSHGIEICIESASKEELAKVMQKFFLQIRKSDGEMYKRKTYGCVRYGLINGLKEIRPDINFASDKEFVKVFQAFKLTLHKLKIWGQPTEHNVQISNSDLERLYESETLGTDRPTNLQNKVFFELLFFLLFSRGRSRMRALKPSNVSIQKNKNGRKYVQLVNVPQSLKEYSNRTVGHSAGAMKTIIHFNPRLDTTRKTGCIFELPGQPQCPVAAIEKYLSKLPPQATFLFAQATDRCAGKPNRTPNIPGIPGSKERIWYQNSALGKNSLAALMKEICKQAELSNSYSNYSIHHTSVSILNSQGYDVKPFLDGKRMPCETDIELCEKMFDILASVLYKTDFSNAGSSMYIIPIQDIHDKGTQQTTDNIPLPSSESPFITASPGISTYPLFSTASPGISSCPVQFLPQATATTTAVKTAPHVVIQPLISGLTTPVQTVSRPTYQIKPTTTQSIFYNPPKIQIIAPNVMSSTAPCPQNIVKPLGVSHFILKTEPNSDENSDVGSYALQPMTSRMTEPSSRLIQQSTPVKTGAMATQRTLTPVSSLGNKMDTTKFISPIAESQQSIDFPTGNQTDQGITTNQTILNLQHTLEKKNEQLHAKSSKITQLEIYQSEYRRLLQEVNVQQQHLLNSRSKNKELLTKIENLRRGRQTSGIISYEQLCCNKKLFKYYTGFSPEEFPMLFQFLIIENSDGPYKNRQQNLSLRSQLVLTLTKLRHNFTFMDLGYRFGVTKLTAKNMFVSWLDHMSKNFENVYVWPHRQTLKAQIPRHFQQDFPTTLAMVKRIKVKICQPSNCLHQGILAVDPRGCVIGCSRLVAGGLSDSDLFENSGFKNKLKNLIDNGRFQHGDGILAENLDIATELNDIGLKLNDVAFSKCDIDDELKTLLQTQRVQTHKILIDKAVCRVRKFRIISQAVPSTLASSSDKIFQVASFITNFMPPLSLDFNDQ